MTLAIAEPDWPTGDLAWGEAAAAIAAKKWRDIYAILEERGQLDPALAPAMERYAISYARWKMAEMYVASQGPVVLTDKTKVPQYNLYLTIANQAQDVVTKLEAELQLLPRRGGGAAKPMKRALPTLTSLARKG
jgi:phage terminase small subunit